MKMWSRPILIAIFCSVAFVNGLNRSKRDADDPYTIETAVGVDQDVIDHYGDDLDDFILTLMSVSTRFFANSNLEPTVNYAVSKIVHLPFDPTANASIPGRREKNIGVSLRSFCDYIGKDLDTKYDIAIYITRKTLRDSNGNQANGLTYRGQGLCSRKSCAIVHDSYFLSAAQVAHETAHLFGSYHDWEPQHSECANTPSIMNRGPLYKWYSWSNCTLNFINEYLKRDDAKCLLEKKADEDLLNSFPINKDLLAASKQCKEFLGKQADPNATAIEADVCDSMWCTLKNGSRGQISPGEQVDGTPCTGGKECRNRKCESIP